MFGNRKDGTKIKCEDPLMKIVPHIMSERHDSQNQYLIEQRTEVLDDFIEKQRANGTSYNYMHIIIATMVRILKERPKLNRFVMNGITYQRDYITVSISVKKVLKDTADETTVKIPFCGNENISEVKAVVDSYIKEAQKTSENSKGVDALLKFFNALPNWFVKSLVGVIKWSDKHGLLPASLVGKYGVSPFHTSVFLTNLKSIKLDYLYHHLYNFGTTGLFISLGKEKMQPVYNEETEQIEVGKVVKMGFVSDERFVDGLFYSNTLKLMKKYLNNPELLLNNPNIATPNKKEIKQDKVHNKLKQKQKKKQEKLLKKQQNKNLKK